MIFLIRKHILAILLVFWVPLQAQYLQLGVKGNSYQKHNETWYPVRLATASSSCNLSLPGKIIIVCDENVYLAIGSCRSGEYRLFRPVRFAVDIPKGPEDMIELLRSSSEKNVSFAILEEVNEALKYVIEIQEKTRSNGYTYYARLYCTISGDIYIVSMEGFGPFFYEFFESIHFSA